MKGMDITFHIKVNAALRLKRGECLKANIQYMNVYDFPFKYLP